MRQSAILTLLLFLLAQQLRAEDEVRDQFNPVRTAVVQQTIAPDARGCGMGDLGAATDPDVHSQYWNPAKYPFTISRAGFAVNYTPWLRKIASGIALLDAVGYLRLGDYQALSGSVRYFTLGEAITEDDLTVKPYEFSVDVAYSHMLSENFSAAVGLRYIYSDIMGHSSDNTTAGSAFAADVAMYHTGYLMMGQRECSFAWGLNISNIGSKISFGGDDNSEFLPTNLRLGMNWTIPFNQYNRLSILADANKLLVPTYPKQNDGEADVDYTDRVQRDYYDISPITGIFKSFADAPGGFKEEMQEIQWSVGMEYNYNDRFMVRLGYHHEAETKGNRKYVTAGAGFKMSVFSIDAAYVFSTAQSNPLDQTMRFTLGFDLDGMKDLFGKRKRR